jgi:hypothetical protein
LTTFAALGDFLLFFQLWLGADKGSFNGFYRLNDHLGTGLARCTGLTSRTRGTWFTFLTRFAGLTFHTLLAAYFSASFTFLTGLTLLARTTVAAFATLAAGGAFALLTRFSCVAAVAVVVTTGTLTTATGVITLMTMSLVLACFPLHCRFFGWCLDIGRGCVGTEQT